jgi:hypothetical protein
MDDRTILNPVTGERATFIETARESGGARSVAEFEISPGGGVFPHRHGDHEERIDVLEGEIEVTAGGHHAPGSCRRARRHRIRRGAHVAESLR